MKTIGLVPNAVWLPSMSVLVVLYVPMDVVVLPHMIA